MIKSISGKRSDRNILKRVTDGVVCSHLLYGIEITCRALNELIKHLASTYNNCIRYLYGLLPSTPALSACAESGVLPFRYKAVLTLCKGTISYLERTEDQGSICFLEEQANLALETVARIQLPSVAGLHRIRPRSWMATLPCIDASIEVQFKKKATAELVRPHFYERIANEYSNHEIRYTDGSKLGDKVGLGVIGNHDEQ